MPDIDLPSGRYFSLTGKIAPGRGGQTGVVLMRSRLLAARTNVEPTLLTFDQTPHYPQVRDQLRAEGSLVDGVRLLNIFEWYRDNPVDDLEPTGDPLPALDHLELVETPHPDGSVYGTRYLRRRDRQEVAVDYRRADGSVYLRLTAPPAGTQGVESAVLLVNSKGAPVGSWPSLRGWRRDWLLRLAEGERRIFLIGDSRHVTPTILPAPDERFHVLHVVHNAHVLGRRRWNSELSGTYVPLFDTIQHLDALITLTERQREDVAARCGDTNTLFVIPNPVEPAPPAPHPAAARERMRFVVVARLEPQKRLEHAIRAFALVVARQPDARLDIYGSGALRAQLEREIADHGLGGAVTLRGHDPAAREALRTATALLMTSRFEGYPLVTLEAMSRGCPVVSYDTTYGPREQISHGVDGFLVGLGDVKEMAGRVLELIDDPELVARMSEAAVVKAAQHDPSTFLHDWRRVLDRVVEQKQRRTRLDSVTLRVDRLGRTTRLRIPGRIVRRRPFTRLAGTWLATGLPAGRRLVLAGRLHVEGHGADASLDDVVITLDAVCDASGAVVPIPLAVTRTRDRFRIRARFDVAEVFGAAGAKDRALRLRLRLVWNNSCWETTPARPRRLAPNYEVSFAEDGAMTLLRGPVSPR